MLRTIKNFALGVADAAEDFIDNHPSLVGAVVLIGFYGGLGTICVKSIKNAKEQQDFVNDRLDKSLAIEDMKNQLTEEANYLKAVELGLVTDENEPETEE